MNNNTNPKNDRGSKLVNALGWYGTCSIILAYALLSMGVIEQKFLYQFLNFTGAIGIVVVSAAKGAYQPMVLNIVWLIIAALALLRL